MLDTEVDQAALARDADAVENVELRLLEGRSHLVLYDLDARAVADRVGAVFEGLDATDVKAHGGVKLERLTPRSGFGAAEEYADLFAQLVDEDHRGLRAVQATRELAQRLRHEASLQADVAVTHLALNLGPGHQSGDRVDDHEVDRTRAHKHVGDLECLLSGVGLRDEELIDVDAEFLRVVGIERVLGVDEGCDAASLLHIGDDVKRERGFARRLGAVDFDDAASGEPADAERDIESDGAGGDDRHRCAVVGAQAHDAALAELSVNLGEGRFEGFFAVCCRGHFGLRFHLVRGVPVFCRSSSGRWSRAGLITTRRDGLSPTRPTVRPTADIAGCDAWHVQ